MIDEHEAPAQVGTEENYLLEEDEEGRASATLSEYRAAAVAAFGPLPALSELRSGLESPNAEFCDWVGSLQASLLEEMRAHAAAEEAAAKAVHEKATAKVAGGVTCPLYGSAETRMLSGHPPRAACRSCGRSFAL